ncbi:MAG: choice-of-anchor Q domain-containing protein [Opitutaceae bacterium]
MGEISGAVVAGTGIIFSIDPLLASLADNGGSTETMRPSSDSPAIDGVFTNPSLLSDQRGFGREVGLNPDIGALEVQVIDAMPEAGSTDTALFPSLSWTSSVGASHEVFLGTDPDSLISEGVQVSPFVPQAGLIPNTTYFWRVDTTVDGKIAPGRLLSFTTRDAGIEVTTLLDRNDGFTLGDVSLREAIADASSETITFSPSLDGQSITLDGSELLIDRSLTIDGSSLGDGITISGDNRSRVFNISVGSVVTLGSLNIIDGATASGTTRSGAGILNAGTLQLLNSTVAFNTATDFSVGAGICNSGTATIRQSTVTGNFATNGGGLFNEGYLLLENSTVADNNANFGGGMVNNADLVIRNSTISGNHAAYSGGGTSAGGIYSVSVDATLELSDSIVSGNTTDGIEKDIGGAVTTRSGVNLIGDLIGTSGLGTLGVDYLVGDASLAPLGDFGGPTDTMRPLLGSLAIDASGDSGLSIDQRGFSRSLGSVDIGAVEVLQLEAMPAVGEVVTTLLPSLSWTASAGATYEVFFGTVPGALVSQGIQGTPFVPSTRLDLNSIYYWRVDTVIDGSSIPGHVLSFQTRDAGIEVTTALDENDGMLSGGVSLREAIAEAVTLDPAETITFNDSLSGQTIELLHSELSIDKPLNIDASALAEGIVISGEGLSRVFSIGSNGDVTLDTLTISNGFITASEDQGAGIFNQGDLTVLNSTISGNQAAQYGGGLGNIGTLTLENCTVAENVAWAAGGGINNRNGTLNLISTSVADNSSLSFGGGIWSSGTVSVTDSILAGNVASAFGSALFRASGSVTALGVNIIDDLTNSSLSVGGSVVVGDPLLLPLGKYGGPTETMPPQRGSPAIDLAGSSSLETDQRGVSRSLYGSAPDVGAVEAIYFTVFDSVDSGSGSLRSALLQANSFTGFSEMWVEFESDLDASVISLTSGSLSIESDLLIDASGLPNGLTISGGGLSRVFSIGSGAEVTFDTLTISDGFITDADDQGAGVFNEGELTIRNSTISDNVSEQHGGAFGNLGTLTLINSTVANNSAVSDAGGISNRGGSVHLISSTIADNTSGNDGGGIWSTGDVTLTDSIVASNSAPGIGIDVSRSAGSVTTFSRNFLSHLQGSSLGTDPSVLVGDPLLAALGDNGGPTQTMMLLPGSLAIDEGGATDLDLDQRGFERVLGAGLDLGAYEASVGAYTADGLTFYATMDPALTAAGVEFEISEDPNFLNTVSSFAGTGAADLVNGARESSEFSYPSGVAQDSFGNLFVADSANNVIRMISPDGAVTTIAGSGDYGNIDGPGKNAQFAFPSDITVGGIGLREDLYVTDLFNHSVRKITRPAVPGQSWTVSTLAGTGIAGFNNGAGSVAKFNYPYGIAVDSAGLVFVADSGNDRIRQIGVDFRVTTFAGPVDTVSVASSSGMVDGVAADARFDHPIALVFNEEGTLYVADRDNHRIREITQTGDVSTLAGDVRGFEDHVGTAARFDSPNGLAIDTTGDLLVIDSKNHAIRKVSTFGGVVDTIAGLGTNGMVDGNIEEALFNGPSALVVDTVNLDGDLIVADTQNHRLRRITIKPIEVTDANSLITIDGTSVSAVIDFEALELNPDTQYYIRWRSLSAQSTQMLGQSFVFYEAPLLTPFESWQALQFGIDANTPSIAGWYVDSSQDGVVNLLKYAFGLDPNVPSQSGLPILSTDEDSLQITYRRALSATDLEYAPEWSTNLVDWYTTDITDELISTDSGIQEIRASVSTSDDLNKFLRIRVYFLLP